MKVRVFSGWSFPSNALDALVQEVVARTTSVRSPGECWIAWSLGGLQALALATERTQEEDSQPHWLVLIASTARFCRAEDGWPGAEPAELRGLQRRLTRDPAAALAGFHALCAGPETSPDAVQSRGVTSLSLDRDDLAEGLDTLASQDVRPLLSRVRMPVLVLHGRLDRIIPSVTSEALAANLPQATRCEHTGAGHDLPLAQSRWTADRIVEFLCR